MVQTTMASSRCSYTTLIDISFWRWYIHSMVLLAHWSTNLYTIHVQRQSYDIVNWYKQRKSSTWYISLHWKPCNIKNNYLLYTIVVKFNFLNLEVLFTQYLESYFWLLNSARSLYMRSTYMYIYTFLVNWTFIVTLWSMKRKVGWCSVIC